tara:strand:+ start:1027 stop:1995 length:969 start_codon:yes stop_codon:yes gene_type:complete
MSDYLNTLLIGTGPMAIDYHKVLKSINVNFCVVGRGVESCNKFYHETKTKPFSGGIKKYLLSEKNIPLNAIISVGIVELKDVAIELIRSGVKNILIEKPGGLNDEELNQISEIAKKYNSKIFIAYNRRFYSSVNKAIEIINEDNGLLSFNFEFTEWTNLINPQEIPKIILQNYFFANSSHVVDLAFYVAGTPKEINTHVSGGLDWHKSGSIFSGSGISKKNALFSYRANWNSPGRWGIEFLTKSYCLILRPMEKLQIQKLNSIETEYDSTVDYSLDEKYKPGLFKQVDCFINFKTCPQSFKLCSIEEQINNYRSFYKQMANY